MQGAHGADEAGHSPRPVGHVDAQPPVHPCLVIGHEQHLRGRHGGTDPGDQRVPVRPHRSVLEGGTEHGQSHGQHHREVGQRVVVDVLVDAAGGPDLAHHGAHVVPPALDPRGLDDPKLRVAVGAGQRLELEQVPAALGGGEHRVGGGDDGGQGWQVVGQADRAGDAVSRVGGDLLLHHRREQLGAAPAQPSHRRGSRRPPVRPPCAPGCPRTRAGRRARRRRRRSAGAVPDRPSSLDASSGRGTVSPGSRGSVYRIGPEPPRLPPWLAATDGSPTTCSPARRARRTRAASSGSGRPARRSPSSPTSASTRCSTAARSRPAWRSATATRPWSTRTWAWSPRSSTRPRSRPCTGTSPSATPVLHHRRRACGRTPSRPSGHRHRARRARPQRQPHQHPRPGRARSERAAPAASCPRRRHRLVSTTPSCSPRCSPPTPTSRSRPRRWTSCPCCGARSTSCSWTTPPSTPPATRRASVRWCSAGSSGAGSWPARPQPSTSWVRRSSARSSPGELVAIDEHGLRTQHFAPAEPKGCLFEFVYLARPDTSISGRSVHAVRVEIGRSLAREHPAEADLVIPVPRAARPAAVGYAQASRASRSPRGWSRTPTWVARSSSRRRPSASSASGSSSTRCARSSAARDWSSSTTRSCAATPSARSCGCCARPGRAEVHVRISSPPVKWPCFYGIDFATRAELIANGLTVERDPQSIGADSLGYVSLEGLSTPPAWAPRPPVPRVLRRRSTRSTCPSPSCSASTCWRARRSRATPRVGVRSGLTPTLLGGGGAAGALNRP